MERDDRVRPRWDSLPPSARMYGTPADPGPRLPRNSLRRVARPLLAVLVAAGLVGVVVLAVLRLWPSGERTTPLADTLAGVRLSLPTGWRELKEAPVTGFTSFARHDDGGLVMVKPMPGPVRDPGASVKEAAERYARLLLKGDRVKVVDDRPVGRGHTRRPVPGLTPSAGHDDGGLVLVKPMPGPVRDPGASVKEAAERYARLLLKGDRVKVVDDRPVGRGHTRALRAQYDDVVNRPAY